MARDEQDAFRGGLNKSRDETILPPGQTPACLNVEFNRDSCLSTRGIEKLGNRAAPASGVRTKAPDSLPPLRIAADSSVPLRGYVYHPYTARIDIAGDGMSDGEPPGVALYHARRGRSFEVTTKFRIPLESEMLYVRNGDDSGPANYDDLSDPNKLLVDEIEAGAGYNEALEECSLIIQQGGDRTMPLVWAIGITNVADKAALVDADALPPSGGNWRVVFMWYDQAEWAQNGGARMRYTLSDGNAASGEYATDALRAIVLDAPVEPGRDYSVSMGLQIDSGSAFASGTAADPVTAWSNDGWVQMALIDEDGQVVTIGTFENTGTGGSPIWTKTRLLDWKGPSDGLEYLSKYGIRYTSSYPLFSGLGYRMIPWDGLGFLPFGSDSAKLEFGGFSLTDLSKRSEPTGYTISTSHVLADSFVTFDAASITTGKLAAGGQAPQVPGVVWAGAANNPDALRNYWCALYGNSADPVLDGARFLLGSQVPASSVNYDAGLSATAPAWSSRKTAIYPFRWHQRDLVIGETRIYSAPIWYADNPRAQFALRTQSLADDHDEPNREALIAHWAMDDAGGGVVRELVGGNDAFLAPFGLGQSDRGTRGKRLTFLSGEGEAVKLDFSDNPILRREMLHALRDGQSGFAIEITCELSEPFMGIPELVGSGAHGLTGNVYVGRHAPIIASWEAQREDEGLEVPPKPLIQLTHRGVWGGSATTGFRAPMGFTLLAALASDQEDEELTCIVPQWQDPSSGGPTATQGFLWGREAEWVGQSITIQFGVHPTGNADEYVCYVSAIPRGAFPVTAGDDLDGEMAWFGATDADTQANQARKISKKDLVRSVITIGGGWAPGSLGYSELNCRMLLDEVRVFGVSAPGRLPARNGGMVAFGEGKIAGRRAYPRTELTIDDIVQPLGNGIETANVVDHLSVVSAPSGRLFYEAEPQDTLKAVERTMLIVAGDTYESYGELGELGEQEEFYFIDTVTPGGASLVLAGSFEGADRKNALAGSFRLIGYAAFADSIGSKALSLGAGASYTPGTTVTDDVIETEPYFTNRAPVSGDWNLRIYSPASGEPISRYTPEWTRGVGETRRNRILGLAPKFGDLYAAARGAVFEVDDRWRSEGPNTTVAQSFEFRAKKTTNGVSIPLASDRIEFAAADVLLGGEDAVLPTSGIVARRWDFWCEVEEFATYQTLLWIGNPNSSPNALAGDGAGEHGMRYWFRITNGRPEWCVGSTQTTDGTTRPPRGIFVARGQGVIPSAGFVHVRFEVEEVDDAGGDYWKIPKIAINGKQVPVTVNAVDDSGVVGAWMRIGGTVGLTNAVYALGAAHDAYSQPREDLPFVLGSVRGAEIASRTLHGWLHGLAGKLAGVVQSSRVGGRVGANFDPDLLDYANSLVRLRALNGGDIGHKVWAGTQDSSGRRIFGVVKSHPFISRFHELGNSNANASFADYEQKLYVTNGGRPASINSEPARFMGLLAPTTAPTHELQRFPLWEENVRAADGPNNDPQGVAAAGAAERQLHLSSFGNNYLRIPFSREMRWETDGTNFDVFAFKCMVLPRKTSGRIPLYSTRAGRDSGNVFVEIRDGEIWVGWYDTFLKKEQAVRTSGQVIYPGYWHYIYVRKHFPRQKGWAGSFNNSDAFDGDSNWNNSLFELTKAWCLDSIVVRRFHRGDPADAPFEDGLWARDASGVRACISFTVDDGMTRPAGTTATGLVSAPAITYTGGSGGAITGSAAVFHEDMVGFYFQFGDGTEAGRLFRIAGYTSTAVIDVVDAQTGAVPDLSAVTAGKVGGVFTGVALVKTEDFDSSTEPDATAHDIDIFGSSEAIDPLAGIAPFDGKFDAFALFTASTATGQNVDIFETARTDEIETGTDAFPTNRLDNPAGATPAGIGALRADSGKTWMGVLTDTYAGTTRVWTQPNEDLELARSVSSVNSEAPQWRYLQGTVLLEGTRKVRVAFYDRDRNIWSNPSPPLTIQPPSEERSNPSGQMRYLLSNLPTSRDRGTIERLVYMTLANGAQYFLVGRVPDNTSTAVAVDKTENEILSGDVLRFDNPAPPECAVIASSGPTMFFGALKQQSDLVMFSKSFFPESVPAAHVLPLVTGGSEPVVAMREIRGQLAVFKARSLWRVRLVGNVAVREFVARVGCLSPTSLDDLDDRIFFTDGRGVYIYTGSGQPAWVGHAMESFFADEVDPTRMWRSAAAVNRARNQFILTTPLVGDESSRHRISCEFDHAYSGVAGGAKQPALYRYSQYEDPAITALCSLPDESGGVDRLMGGTEQGLVVRLDSSDTQKAMVGEDTHAFGDVELIVDAGATETRVPIASGLFVDEAFGGARGAPVWWEEDDGTVHHGEVLFGVTAERALYLDRRMTAPPEGTLLTLGSPRRSWETPWRSFQVPERRKRGLHVDVTWAKGAAGQLRLECMATEDPTKKVAKDIVLTGQTHERIDVGSIYGHQIKVRLRTVPGRAAERFELTRMTITLADNDQKKK